MSESTRWSLQGDYFENCSCDVLCPCEVSPLGPLMAEPTQGHCEVALAFHIDSGRFGDVPLDGLSLVAVGRTPGVMSQGNMKMGVYVDDRANPRQQEALQTIFSGGAGGPMAAFAPLISEMLGVKTVPISFRKDGKKRAVVIPNVMDMGVEAIPSMKPDGSEVWLGFGHPFAPDQLAIAVGKAGSTFSDYGMSWDNSGKNGHYARIDWSGS
jgi:hypothetical protein